MSEEIQNNSDLHEENLPSTLPIQSPVEQNRENKVLFHFYFLMFGLATLLSWNAILADLSFFIYYLNDYNPDTSFSFMNISPNIVFQIVILFQKKKNFSYKNRLIIGLIASLFCLIAIPFAVYPFGVNSGTGFALTVIIIIFNGLSCAVLSGGFFGLASFFPLEYIVWLSAGQGFSGILMNVIEYITLFAFHTGDPSKKEKELKQETVIFFSISGLIIVGCLVCLILGYRTDFFKKYLKDVENPNNTNINVMIGNEHEKLVTSDGEEEKNAQITEKNEGSNIEKEFSFGYLVKILLKINILTALVYVVTFTLFPAITIKQELFNINETYKINTLFFIYNVSDTIGRYAVQLFEKNMRNIYIFTVGRIIFVILLPLNYYLYIRCGWNEKLISSFTLIFLILFGMTNGIGSTLCFSIAPTLVEDKLKGKAGSSISLFFIIGIFVGSVIQFGSKAWLKQFEDKF